MPIVIPDVDEFDYALLKIYDTTQLDISPLDGEFRFHPSKYEWTRIVRHGMGKTLVDHIRGTIAMYLQQAEVYYIENEHCRQLVSTEDGETLMIASLTLHSVQVILRNWMIRVPVIPEDQSLFLEMIQ